MESVTMESKKRKQGRNAIPRPKNSFMTYRMDVQYRILAERGRINNKEVSKIAGQMWNAESDTVKSFYRRKAELGKLDHARQYPDYKYSPKKTIHSPKPKSIKQTEECSLLRGFDLNGTSFNLPEYYNIWLNQLTINNNLNENYIIDQPALNINLPMAMISDPSIEELMSRYINIDYHNTMDFVPDYFSPFFITPPTLDPAWSYMLTNNNPSPPYYIPSYPLLYQDMDQHLI